MQFLHICDSASQNSTNHWLCSNVVLTIGKKKAFISGPAQFKTILFKGELYIF